MSATAFLLGGVILAVIAYLGLLPILSERKAAQVKEQHYDTQDLRTRYYLLLDSIRDLDFDYDMHKISYEVYAEQRKMLIGRSVSILMQLDKAEAELGLLDDEIEAEIEAYRHQHRAMGNDAIEKSVTSHRKKVAHS